MKAVLIVSLSLNAGFVIAFLLRYLSGPSIQEETESVKATKRRDELIAQNIEAGMTTFDARRSADDLLQKESARARAAFLEAHGLPPDPPPPPPPSEEELLRQRERAQMYQNLMGSAGLGTHMFWP